MRKANLIYLLVVVLYSCTSNQLSGQTHSAFQFIEPSIGISYDSTKYKVGARFTADRSEAYRFVGKDTAEKMSILVTAMPAVGNLGKDLRDKALNQMLENLDQSKNTLMVDSVEIKGVDKKIREIGEFGFIGMTMYLKFLNANSTVLQGYYVGPNGMVEIEFSSHHNNLEDAYAIVTEFLKGFRPYSKEEVDKRKEEISK